MGEQFIDLFTAGAYALAGRLYAAIADPSVAWLFYVLAAAGIVFAIVEASIEQRQEFWLRHLAAVCLAAVLTLVPQRIDITALTYGAPGEVERIFGTHLGAAPQLTYWIERLGASAASSLQSLTHQKTFLAVPGVAAQVESLASDPATIDDPQLRANLEIWRRRIVPQLLANNPALAQQLQDANLSTALLTPTPVASQFVGPTAAGQAQAVQSLLAANRSDLNALVAAQTASLNQIAHDAGAQPWGAGPDSGGGIALPLGGQFTAVSARAMASSMPAFDDALRRGDAVLLELRSQLPVGSNSMPITTADRLYDVLGRSILYTAGSRLAHDTAARAALGSLCQRSGDAVCRSAMGELVDAARKVRVVGADKYNSDSWTTWLQQPIATTLLTLTSLMLSTLATLVVSVLPFALGVAKAMAILISMIGAWLLLWPGRSRIALSWMVGPISFVSLWGVLFNLWSDLEPGLMQIAVAVSDSTEGSFSARRLMSIAISLGYMGLPSLALGVVYGESGRALYHASARLETALLMAWHTRGSIAAFSRRWIVNSPMVRRWNQRAYRAIGMGPLRTSNPRTAQSTRGRPRGGDFSSSASPKSRTAPATASSRPRGQTETGVAANSADPKRRQRTTGSMGQLELLGPTKASPGDQPDDKGDQTI